jgi:hypothetical protein
MVKKAKAPAPKTVPRRKSTAVAKAPAKSIYENLAEAEGLVAWLRWRCSGVDRDLVIGPVSGELGPEPIPPGNPVLTICDPHFSCFGDVMDYLELTGARLGSVLDTLVGPGPELPDIHWGAGGPGTPGRPGRPGR